MYFGNVADLLVSGAICFGLPFDVWVGTLVLRLADCWIVA